jgi:hypothetical protein
MITPLLAAMSKLGVCAVLAGWLGASGATPYGVNLDLNHHGSPSPGYGGSSDAANFTISAPPVSGLYPGAHRKLELVVTNSLPYDLKVTSLSGRLQRTSKAGCAPVATNLVVRAYSGRPKLPFEVSSHWHRPVGSIELYMPNTVVDGCQRATFTITFQGSATKVHR